MGWILLRLIPVLRDGKTYVIDEIDESLHPTLVAQIVEIFNSEESNPNNAQLIFSTHDVSLLDGTIYGRDILDRDQIWFVEKDLKGCSYLYSLYDIKYLARKDDKSFVALRREAILAREE